MKQLGGAGYFFSGNEIDQAVEGEYEFITQIAYHLWTEFNKEPPDRRPDVYHLKLVSYEWPEDVE